MDDHDDTAIATRLRRLAAELPADLPAIGPVKQRGRRRHRLTLAGTMLAAAVLVGAIAIPVYSLLPFGDARGPSTSERFDPLKPAPHACPDDLARRSGGTPAQFAARMQGHLPTWLPHGFGLLSSNGMPGRTPFGVWTDRRCRQVQLVLVPGGAFASSVVAIHVRAVGSWLMLIGAPGGCPSGAARCFDYKALIGSDALLLHTRGLTQGEADHVARSITATGAQEVTATIQIDPEDGTRFDPPLPGKAPAISAAEAAARFKSADRQWNGPGAATIELGLYTSNLFDHRLAYGYRTHECQPPPNNPFIQGSPGLGFRPSCTFWLFLDANTGRMLEATWQVP